MPEPYSISLLNDSFPPLIDGVANTDMCKSLVLHNGGNIRKVKVNECR